jgi:hypothetical protein
MSCGCKQPDERHGDDRNIVRQDLEDAAEAAQISAQEVVKNIQSGFETGAEGNQGPAGTSRGEAQTAAGQR